MPDSNTTRTSSETNFNLPNWLLDPIRSSVERADELSQQDYPQYSGARVPEHDRDTTDAFQMIRQLDDAGKAELAKANKLSDQGVGIASVAPEYIRSGLDLADRSVPFAERAGQYGIQAADYFDRAGQTWLEADQAGYMNPYMAAAIDPAAREVDRRAAAQFNQLGGTAALQGSDAFGGSRATIGQGISQRNHLEEIGDLYSRGLAQAYESGANIFGQDQNRLLNVGSSFLNTGNLDLGIASAIQGAGSQYLSGAQGQINASQPYFQAAGQQMGLADRRQNYETNAINQMLRAGQIQEARKQDQLNVGYSDFLEQRNWPYEQLQFFQGISGGVPSGIGTTSTMGFTNPPNPNAFSQGIGAAVGGIGAAADVLSSGVDIFDTVSGFV